MKIRIYKIILLFGCCAYGAVFAQQLHKICPVVLKKGNLPDSISFVLTTADFNTFRGRDASYAPAIEIVDADQPWPPRWFALHPSDISSEIGSGFLMLNASCQNDHFMFYTVIKAPQYNSYLGILICNKNMEIVDSFFCPGREIDSHDFIASPDGNMLFFAHHDTTMDLRKIYHNTYDSAVKVIYESIEISDAKGTSLFSWNPLYNLGFDAVYLPYRYVPGVMSSQSQFEWSHGNSLQYDYDGDIIYSLKHIGIGKISRKDGHVIWRIDRKQQKANTASGLIPIYLQHSLQAVKDDQGHISYTVLSNGDSAHPVCRAYRFTVDFDAKGQQIVKLLKTYTPSEAMTETGGGGNFDMDAKGDYLFNYGLFKQDTTLTQRPLFEYHVSGDKINSAEYNIANPYVFSYRVHRMSGCRPERPAIVDNNGVLSTNFRAEKYTWYQLSGQDLKTIHQVHIGEKYSPDASGYYCVACPYGIGWVVSRPLLYTRK